MSKEIFIILNWGMVVGFVGISLYLSYKTITAYSFIFKKGVKGIINGK